MLSENKGDQYAIPIVYDRKNENPFLSDQGDSWCCGAVKKNLFKGNTSMPESKIGGITGRAVSRRRAGSTLSPRVRAVSRGSHRRRTSSYDMKNLFVGSFHSSRRHTRY